MIESASPTAPVRPAPVRSPQPSVGRRALRAALWTLGSLAALVVCAIDAVGAWTWRTAVFAPPPPSAHTKIVGTASENCARIGAELAQLVELRRSSMTAVDPYGRAGLSCWWLVPRSDVGVIVMSRSQGYDTDELQQCYESWTKNHVGNDVQLLPGARDGIKAVRSFGEAGVLSDDYCAIRNVGMKIDAELLQVVNVDLTDATR